jgi:hypothetical protein
MIHQEIIDQIYNGSINYRDLPKEMRKNRHIATAAIIYDPSNFDIVSRPLLDDYSLMLDVLKYHGHLIKYFPSRDIFEDYNIVLAAVTNDGMVLKYVFNYEIKCEYYVDVEYHRGGRYTDIIEEIINDDKKNFINNFEIVIAAVTQDGLALQYASEELKSDFEIVIAAVKQNGLSIRFASDELQNNLTIIINAIAQDSCAVWDLPFELYATFKEILENAETNNIKYFYDKINDGTLIPCAQIWIKYFPQEIIKELNEWVKIIKHESRNLFNVLFNNDKQKLGYYDPVRSNIMSYFEPLETQKKRDPIINDILSFSL